MSSDSQYLDFDALQAWNTFDLFVYLTHNYKIFGLTWGAEQAKRIFSDQRAIYELKKGAIARSPYILLNGLPSPVISLPVLETLLEELKKERQQLFTFQDDEGQIELTIFQRQIDSLLTEAYAIRLHTNEIFNTMKRAEFVLKDTELDPTRTDPPDKPQNPISLKTVNTEVARMEEAREVPPPRPTFINDEHQQPLMGIPAKENLDIVREVRPTEMTEEEETPEEVPGEPQSPPMDTV